MATALALASDSSVARRTSALALPDDGFDFPELRRFTSIPEYHHGIAVLHGMVVVYATDVIGREGIIDGAYYVKESQYPYGGGSIELWLRRELAEEHVARRAQPHAKLRTERHVVRAVRHPRMPDHWEHVLESGFRDGPIQDWCHGFNFVGKVVGIYLPSAAGAGGAA